MSISKIFVPNFVCVLPNERYKTYQTGFSFCRLGHDPGVGLRGAGVPRGSKHFFSKMVMWHIKLTGMTSRQNASKIFILGSNWRPWGEVKRSNIIKFQLPCQFQRFLYQTCVRVLTNKRNYIEQSFYMLLGSCPRVGLGVLGVKSFSVGICDGAPLAAHSSFKFSCIFMNIQMR